MEFHLFLRYSELGAGVHVSWDLRTDGGARGWSNGGGSGERALLQGEKIPSVGVNLECTFPGTGVLMVGPWSHGARGGLRGGRVGQGLRRVFP